MCHPVSTFSAQNEVVGAGKESKRILLSAVLPVKASLAQPTGKVNGFSKKARAKNHLFCLMTNGGLLPVTIRKILSRFHNILDTESGVC